MHLLFLWHSEQSLISAENKQDLKPKKSLGLAFLQGGHNQLYPEITCRVNDIQSGEMIQLFKLTTSMKHETSEVDEGKS